MIEMNSKRMEDAHFYTLNLSLGSASNNILRCDTYLSRFFSPLGKEKKAIFGFFCLVLVQLIAAHGFWPLAAMVFDGVVFDLI